VNGSENAKPEFQKKQSEQLIEKYGFDNWYDWRWTLGNQVERQ